ncbi:MAG: DUF2851 family protein [Verrucomicrobiota bacterium]|nr:DUF2851 family protein [Verrucomicrobiota bacterium]
MFASEGNFYARWRSHCRAADFLHDESNPPAERLLQAIWQHQRIRRDGLQTSASAALRVLHPGFASAGGGPDFCGAVIQFAGEAPRSGDVEIDLRAANWRAHGHDRNPRFQNVLLHVVWDDAPPAANGPAVLSLKNILDAPLAELGLALESEPSDVLPEALRGQCSAPLRDLESGPLAALLRQAATVRFENKAAQFRARARGAGWEQTLWENLFRALGYRHNAWPMQTLAESRSRWMPADAAPFALQARLLGLSGLLPPDLTRTRRGADTYVRRIWDSWWRERDTFSDCALPRAVWTFHGLRPANHPQRRLALAAHWLASANLLQKLESWGVSDLPDRALPRSLLEILQIGRDDFWSWHWTFQSPRLKRPQPLLGASRVTDLAVNVVLPWLWIRAGAGGNAALQKQIERRYFAWPPAGDNSVLRLARQRLLGATRRRVLQTAAAQQGLIQIVRDFCARSNALCRQCRFPELARDFVASEKKFETGSTVANA